ncbi:extracellular solute-binding protein [Bacteriovorax sp. DB6_IX]|uniref:extracellular solute-binding protein n=1 Tax=Bacteriovorax sp. DB6_IX TaxID=1353530 RepID=UPI000389F5AA|nr:extracellular solute-binding protein [Bacteriovorax sp. DB6_IX]EQC48109.1 ABC transporter, solute-binding protein [Bacteriovorax sp. DB6_IX]
MKYLSIASILLFTAYAQAKSLTVYTSRKEHLVKDIFKTYEKETGVKINYKTGKAGALIQNIKAELKDPKVDIFMTVDAGNLWYASSEGLLESTKSDVLTSHVPAHLRDRDNRWFGLSVRARTTVVNTNLVKKGTNISYEELAKPEWKGKLCLRTSKKVYNQSLVAMLIGTHGYDKAKSIVKGWVANKVDIFSNDTNVLKAVAAGQCAVGIVNTYYFGRLIKKQPKLPLAIMWPNQKSYGVHINVSGAGIVKNSKHQEDARKFLEWLASDEAQKQFAQVNMEYPILKTAPQTDIVKSWGEFKPNTAFNLTDAGKLQKKAIKLMHEVGYK